MVDQTSPPSTSGRLGQSTDDRMRSPLDGESAHPRPAAGGAVGDRRAHWRRRRRVQRVRIRVNAKGAAYVAGLQQGRVYEAKVKLKWPDTVWPQGTGLSHTCFLLKGMYELVQEADATG